MRRLLKTRLLNGSLEMEEYAETEWLDTASVSNTFVLFKHLCHLFSKG